MAAFRLNVVNARLTLMAEADRRPRGGVRNFQESSMTPTPAEREKAAEELAALEAARLPRRLTALQHVQSPERNSLRPEVRRQKTLFITQKPFRFAPQ
jgi:hypothetical protein